MIYMLQNVMASLDLARQGSDRSHCISLQRPSEPRRRANPSGLREVQAAQPLIAEDNWVSSILIQL